jgi:hypothetical protein
LSPYLEDVDDSDLKTNHLTLGWWYATWFYHAKGWF